VIGAAHAVLKTVERPLVLDLDGTLLRTDTLAETLLRLAASDPLALADAAAALRHGRAAFKQHVAAAQPIDAAALVYNDEVLALAQAARATGRPVYLVTAADQAIADAVAGHLGIFDGVYGSDGTRNLKGAAKSAFLVDRFGEGGFDYAGDAAADLAVWRHAATAIVVDPAPGLLRRVQAACGNVQVLGRAPTTMQRVRTWARALRVHQWAKNILVFLPVIAAHRTGFAALAQAAIGFVAFSLCASSVYVLNDLLDLPHDRLHPSKRRRPFASGALKLNQAPPMIAACLGGGFLLALTLNPRFLLMLTVYYACTVTYSFGLKRKPVWDVMMLAGLYTLRVFAGSAATGIVISPWLLAFSMFLFFSLAVVKRQTELVQHLRSGKTEKLSGRGYLPEDLGMLSAMAASSGYMAVLVMALYVNSGDVLPLYRHPAALWTLCPVLLFWVSRVLMLAHRGTLHDDPVVFALRDRVSLLLGAVGLCAFVVGAW
jgi:4-hydroxybenzoate polyprenyltransferase/phosphoserine phosphatase